MPVTTLNDTWNRSMNFNFLNRAKGRYRVRGEPNRSEKWILREILHRYSNAVFLSIPSYRFRRVSCTTHARDHLVGGVKKNAAMLYTVVWQVLVAWSVSARRCVMWQDTVRYVSIPICAFCWASRICFFRSAFSLFSNPPIYHNIPSPAHQNFEQKRIMQL